MWNLNNLNGNEWSESEDQAMLDLINRHLSPRIRWSEISEAQLMEGRTLQSLKERIKRLHTFLVFENEKFQLNTEAYTAHKKRVEMIKTQTRKKNEKSQIRQATKSELKWDFMTTAETAELLRVTPATIRNMVKDKRLKSISFKNSYTIRIPRSEIERLLS